MREKKRMNQRRINRTFSDFPIAIRTRRLMAQKTFLFAFIHILKMFNWLFWRLKKLQICSESQNYFRKLNWTDELILHKIWIVSVCTNLWRNALAASVLLAFFNCTKHFQMRDHCPSHHYSCVVVAFTVHHVKRCRCPKRCADSFLVDVWNAYFTVELWLFYRLSFLFAEYFSTAKRNKYGNVFARTDAWTHGPPHARLQCRDWLQGAQGCHEGKV